MISGNFANDGGGGIFCGNDSIVTITNCTITENFAGSDGGAVYVREATAIIRNSILYGNTAEWGKELSFIERTANNPAVGTVSYSNIQGGQAGVYVSTNSILNWGPGNINVDPAFASPMDSDYHLQSQAGRWDPNSESWVQDGVTSRAIDAGNPGYQLADEPQDANNLRINMGAYGGTVQASKTPAGWALLGDMNNDGVIDLQDHATQATMWLITADSQPGDLDRNGIINIGDLCLLLADWLNKTTWCEY